MAIKMDTLANGILFSTGIYTLQEECELVLWQQK